jgi:hypothetical protein
LYFIFSAEVTILFLILGMHILLTIFMCYGGIEMSTNPNYGASSLV